LALGFTTLNALFTFGQNVDAAKSPGFGKEPLENLGELGDVDAPLLNG
jgi:hypothetical protein